MNTHHLPRTLSTARALTLWALGAALAGAIGVSVSCAGPGISKKADVVRADIDRARKSGAYTCAPRELALAESNVDFAENELAEGDALRAQQHIDVAVENANLALVNSKDCAPKRVVIKQKTDKDGDGLLDDVDGCPDDPEDRDLFEDEDGCPETDNDKDGVLDALDRCPNTPGPADNGGCPFGDKDGDGIPDPSDACPDAPEDKDNDRDTDGRPDVDADNDGIEDCVPGCELLPVTGADGKPVPPPVCDNCSNAPEDKDGFADTDGCPEVDNDNDGLLDNVDACPNDAGPAELQGCPDRDADKIADRDDKCPDEKGVAQPENPEQHGCPRKDKDGDGILDVDDKCPDVVGVAQPDNPAKHGCPPELKLVVIKKDRIEIKQQVQFDTAKATIKPGSAKLLAEVGKVIRMSPDIAKVTIEGHTDDVGDDAYNMNLSQERANAVRQWLIDKEKVDPDLLEAVGFGETKPIASNRTSAGRQQNRRSEFKVERR